MPPVLYPPPRVHCLACDNNAGISYSDTIQQFPDRLIDPLFLLALFFLLRYVPFIYLRLLAVLLLRFNPVAGFNKNFIDIFSLFIYKIVNILMLSFFKYLFNIVYRMYKKR